MLILCYDLQGHFQFALRRQKGPGQGHKGSAPWLGEEPGQNRHKSHCILLKKREERKKERKKERKNERKKERKRQKERKEEGRRKGLLGQMNSVGRGTEAAQRTGNLDSI